MFRIDCERTQWVLYMCPHTCTIALDKHATTDTVASQHILLLEAKLSMAYAVSVVSEQLEQSRAHPGWHGNGNGV